MARIGKALVGQKIAVEFFKVTTEAKFSSHVLGDTNKTQPRIIQRHAIMSVPALQEAATHCISHAANSRPSVHPAWVTKPHPGFCIAFIHVLHWHTAHAIRQRVVLGASDRMGQLV